MWWLPRLCRWGQRSVSSIFFLASITYYVRTVNPPGASFDACKNIAPQRAFSPIITVCAQGMMVYLVHVNLEGEVCELNIERGEGSDAEYRLRFVTCLCWTCWSISTSESRLRELQTSRPSNPRPSTGSSSYPRRYAGLTYYGATFVWNKTKECHVRNTHPHSS